MFASTQDMEANGMLLEYIEFILTASNPVRVLRGDAPGAMIAVISMLQMYVPTALLGLYLFMPSQKHNSRCAEIAGMFCIVGILFGFFVSPWFKNPYWIATASIIGRTAVSSVFALIIGFFLRKLSDGKKHRKGIAVSLILLHFVVWTGLLFYLTIPV
jgi:hypothetical protein